VRHTADISGDLSDFHSTWLQLHVVATWSENCRCWATSRCASFSIIGICYS